MAHVTLGAREELAQCGERAVSFVGFEPGLDPLSQICRPLGAGRNVAWRAKCETLGRNSHIYWRVAGAVRRSSRVQRLTLSGLA